MVLESLVELMNCGIQYVHLFVCSRILFSLLGVRLFLSFHNILIFFQVHGMLSQMDPSLVAYCDKMAAQGGPTHMPDDIGVSSLPSVPVVQLGTVTRASARLRNVQPDANLQSYEASKRPKKNADTVLSGSLMSVMCV